MEKWSENKFEVMLIREKEQRYAEKIANHRLLFWKKIKEIKSGKVREKLLK